MKSAKLRSSLSVVPSHNSAPVADLHEQIYRRAQELYEQRGREEGHALDDWLQAEAEVKGEGRAASASL